MKKYFIGMLALVLAVGFSAFTVKTKSTNQQFKFVGSSLSDYYNTSSVQWVEYNGGEQCTDGDFPCIVEPESSSVDTPLEVAQAIDGASGLTIADRIKNALGTTSIRNEDKDL